MSKFDDIVSKVKKEFGNDQLIVIGKNISDVKRIPFPSPSANYPFYGGIPEGRVIQISGLEHSGKTALALTLIGEYQRNNPKKKVAFVDVEHALDKIWAQTLGVDLSKLYYIDPLEMSGEQVLTMLSQLFEAEDLGLVVLDSIAALSTQEEFDTKDITKVSYQTMAKPLSKWFRIVNEQLRRNGGTLICINQLRANIGNMYQPWIEPAGAALKFASSITIRCGTRKFINEAGEEKSDSIEDPQGIRIKFKVIKNKITVNNRGGGYLTVRFRTGVDVISDTLDIAILFGIVRQAGSWLQLIDKTTGEILQDKDGTLLKFQGKQKLREWFHKNPEEFYKYRDKVNQELSKYDEFNGAPQIKLVDDTEFIKDEEIEER